MIESFLGVLAKGIERSVVHARKKSLKVKLIQATTLNQRG